MEGLNETFGCKRCSPAVRMVHDNDVLDSKQVLGDGYGTECVHSASTGDYDREDRGGRSDLLALFILKDLAGIHFAWYRFRHRMWNVHGARVVAIDHNRPQGNRLLERFTHV